MRQVRDLPSDSGTMARHLNVSRAEFVHSDFGPRSGWHSAPQMTVRKASFQDLVEGFVLC